jgi:predicted metal-dependent TIM-barrel fold hydrolase
VLSGAVVNQILAVVLGNEPLVKRPRTWVSLNKPLNPQPLASATPRTRTAAKATAIIDIQDDSELKTFPSTVIIEQSPPLQLPNLITASPHQTITSEPMQLDHPEIAE